MTSTRFFSHGFLLPLAIACATNTVAEPLHRITAPPTPALAPTAPMPQAATSQPADTKPIATVESSIDGIRVEVTQLRRMSGGTVELRFAVINDTDRDVNYSEAKFFSPQLSELVLIDPIGKKKYFIVQDKLGTCVCSGASQVNRRSRVRLWARFPAPPESVERISIVFPSIPPVDDVPVSR